MNQEGTWQKAFDSGDMDMRLHLLGCQALTKAANDGLDLGFVDQVEAGIREYAAAKVRGALDRIQGKAVKDSPQFAINAVCDEIDAIREELDGKKV